MRAALLEGPWEVLVLNNKYTIRVEHPLLRLGLSIETEASEKYVVRVLEKMMGLIRQFNESPVA